MAKKRTARKAAGRAKSGAKKSARKPAKKSARKPARKSARKPVRKSARKPAKKAAAKKAARRAVAKKAAAAQTLTLTEVSRRTGISMPTLQRYKKMYQARLQTVGKGRAQRYKPESLETFKQIKRENLKRRGRPRKAAAPKAAKARPRAKAAAAPEGLISLSEIGRRTKISYPTLLRYVRLHGDRIPSHGSGRKRRFPVAAVAVFAQLRKESRRGRRKGGAAAKGGRAGAGLEARLRRLEKSQAALERQMKRLVRALRKPLVKGV